MMMKIKQSVPARLLLLLLAVFSLTVVSCSKDDDDEGGSGTANVKISVTQGTKRSGKYNYKVSVSAKGVSASDVKEIGITYGPTSGASGHISSAKGTTSTVRSLSYSANSTFYIKGFCTTSIGKSDSKVERIKVPK